MSLKRYFPALLLLTITVGGLVRADEGPSADDIAQWVKQLDADEYAARQTAQKNLERAGKAAIDAVSEAAVGESQEAAVRAMDILQKHFRSEDAAVKQAAEAVLKKLADADSTTVAERAENALKPEPSKPQQPEAGNTPAGPRIIPFGGGGVFRIEARAIAIGGKGAHRVTIKNVDGNKEIDVEENDRKIKIVETADGHIKMNISGKEEDMKSEKEVEADSAEALKEKDPDAYKIYEKYSKGGGAARIEFRALPAGPRALPRAIPRRLRPADGGKGFEDAIKRLEEARKQLEDAEGVQAEALERAIKQLEKIRGQLEDGAAEIEKEADE